MYLSNREMFTEAFRLPADFDDTFVNIGLGALLHDSQTKFPNAHKAWQDANRNVSSAFRALKRYAYRPLSADTGVNTIDPRTYFYMYKFFENQDQPLTNPAFVATWVSSYG